jgi:arginase
VIGVRYWDDRPTQDDESALDAYQSAAAYTGSSLVVRYSEPNCTAAIAHSDPVERIGMLCGILADQVASASRLGQAVLLTGATCSHAPGVAGGLQRAYGVAARIGIVWLDAHGDFNTPGTTLSGGLYGMPLAVCAGLGLARWRELSGLTMPIPTDRIMLVDARTLDPPEAQLIHATTLVIAAGADGRAGASFTDAVDGLAAHCDLIYLHVDTDVLDPAFMPSAHLCEPDGLSLDQTVAIIETTMATGKVAAVAIASVRRRLSIGWCEHLVPRLASDLLCIIRSGSGGAVAQAGTYT